MNDYARANLIEDANAVLPESPAEKRDEASSQPRIGRVQEKLCGPNMYKQATQSNYKK